ncbi:MAG: FHA domain-containing protein, partial [Acidobacteriota bacterium]
MKWRLIAQLGDGPQRFELRDGDNIVGSDRRAFIRLAEPTVSRRHARITVDGEHLRVEDLGSRNGTWLGRRRLEEPTSLDAGSLVVFATVPARLERVADEDVEAALLFELSGKHAAVEEESVETAGVSLLQLFTLDRLPKLLDAVDAGEPDALARRIDEHLDQLVPGKWHATPRGDEVGSRRIALRPDADIRV